MIDMWTIEELELDKLYHERNSFYKSYQTSPIEDWEAERFDVLNKEIHIRERNLKLNKITTCMRNPH